MDFTTAIRLLEDSEGRQDVSLVADSITLLESITSSLTPLTRDEVFSIIRELSDGGYDITSILDRLYLLLDEI